MIPLPLSLASDWRLACGHVRLSLLPRRIGESIPCLRCGRAEKIVACAGPALRKRS